MFLLCLCFHALFNYCNAGTLQTTMPYGAADVALFPAQFGDLRSTRGSNNIPCVTWNTNLAAQAQIWANQCETAFSGLSPQPASVTTIDCYTDGLGVNIFTSTTDTDVPNTVFTWMVEGDLYYTYDTDTCLAGQEFECQNYKQWASAGVQEIGCGKAQCSAITGTRGSGAAGFVTICAYNSIQDQTVVPFSQGTCSITSGLCPPNTNTCQAFAIDNLCCSSTTQTSCSVTCRGPWLRMFSRAAGNHFYTTSTTEQANATSIGYANEGNEGYVMRAPYRGTILAGDPLFSSYCETFCPGKLQIYRMYSRQKKDHLYTTSYTEYLTAAKPLNGGYYDNGIAGYCMPTNNTCGATVPIYRYLRSGLFNADHFYSTSGSSPSSQYRAEVPSDGQIYERGRYRRGRGFYGAEISRRRGYGLDEYGGGAYGRRFDTYRPDIRDYDRGYGRTYDPYGSRYGRYELGYPRRYGGYGRSQRGRHDAYGYDRFGIYSSQYGGYGSHNGNGMNSIIGSGYRKKTKDA